ncbi:hypothetical protein GCM10027562_13550 [Arthrobacter pigmenti]
MLGNATHIHVCMDSGEELHGKVQSEVVDSKYHFRPLELMPAQKMSPEASAVIEFKGPYAEPAVRSPSETEAPPQSPPAPYLPDCYTGREPVQHSLVVRRVEAEQVGIFDGTVARTPSR